MFRQLKTIKEGVMKLRLLLFIIVKKSKFSSTPGPTSVARPCYDLTPITHSNIFAN